MAKKDPAFLFYPSDFYIGVSNLTNEQVGKYIRLLCLQHLKEGKLDEIEFQSICQNDKLIESKFIIENNFRINIRLRSEIESRRKYCESRKVNRSSKNINEELKKLQNEDIALIKENKTNKDPNSPLNKVYKW